MKMCCWVSFGIYNTWHSPPGAEGWLGGCCKAKLLPTQPWAAAWLELLCADLNPDLLRTAVLCWEILLLLGCCQWLMLAHASCNLNHGLNIRRPCATPQALEAPWPPARELPSVPLSLCLLPYPEYLHTLGAPSHPVRIWGLSAPPCPGGRAEGDPVTSRGQGAGSSNPLLEVSWTSLHWHSASVFAWIWKPHIISIPHPCVFFRAFQLQFSWWTHLDSPSKLCSSRYQSSQIILS